MGFGQMKDIVIETYKIPERTQRVSQLVGITSKANVYFQIVPALEKMW